MGGCAVFGAARRCPKPRVVPPVARLRTVSYGPPASQKKVRRSHAPRRVPGVRVVESSPSFESSLMPLPVVAIVGRPNVGKSSLFNMLLGRRTSIVEPTEGVTRDRVSAICELDDVFVELVDTGGVGVVDRDDLGEHVQRQIEFALRQAHLTIFLVDARTGLTALDREAAKLLKRYIDKTVLVANKVDEDHLGDQIGEFVKLGFGEPMPLSAMNGLGKRELIECIQERVGDVGQEAPVEAIMRVAIVGKRNAGKSTFINALAGEERVIVSEIPGTTRDSIDVRFEKDGRTIIAIDTAGLRKKRKLADDIEYYAMVRALDSIRRADVVLFLIDATEPVGQVDKKLAGEIAAAYKPCIIVVNKWDLARGRASTEEYGDYLSKVMPGIDYAPVAFTTASRGRNVPAVMDLASEMFKQSQMRVGTGRLNAVLRAALDQRPPKAKRGRRPPKVYYAAQVAVAPPTVVLFTNSPRLIGPQFERFLINRFREALPFGEIPIRLLYKARRPETEPHP